MRSCTACWPSAARVVTAPSSVNTRSIRSRFMALSSTTSMCAPVRRGPNEGGSGMAANASLSPWSPLWKGNSNQKVLPWPSSLWTPISPPISSTKRLQIDKPRPVPPKRRLMLASAWVKGANSWASASGAMPMPLSHTSKRSRTAVSPISRTWTNTVTSPLSVNLMAFPVRLNNTCSKRSPSPSNGPS